MPRGGVKETEARETIQREPYLTADSFPPRLILAFGMSKSSPFRPLCCPDRKRICKQDPGHGLHIVRGRCIVHKSLFRSHFGAIMPDFPRTRIGTEAPTATQQATFGHKNTDTDACLGRNAHNKRILSQSIQIAFTKPNNQPQHHSETNLLDHPYD